MYHWGFNAWAIYCIPAIPIAYAVYVRREIVEESAHSAVPFLKICRWLVGVVIDVLIMYVEGKIRHCRDIEAQNE